MVFGAGSGEVVAFAFAKIEKVVGHDGADGVHTGVGPGGVAAAIAEKPSDGIGGAGGEFGAEDIVSHGECECSQKLEGLSKKTRRKEDWTRAGCGLVFAMASVSLSEIHSQIWQSLQDAVTDMESAWRVCSLGTVDAYGCPRSRMVVLRDVNAESRELLVFTDPRTPKWQELLEKPLAEILFWNAREKVQLRCQCKVTLHEEDELAARYQAQLPVHVAGDYAAERTPGTVIEDLKEGAELGEKWSFGVMALTVEEMDWLQLRREGHRRAGFRHEGGEWAMNWLQP